MLVCIIDEKLEVPQMPTTSATRKKFYYKYFDSVNSNSDRLLPAAGRHIWEAISQDFCTGERLSASSATWIFISIGTF